MRPRYITFFFCLLGFTACNNSNNTTTNSSSSASAVPAQPVQSKLSDAGTHMLMGVVTKYYALKNALVATKAADATQAASQLAAATDSFSAYLQTDSAHIATLKPYVDTIGMQSKAITTTNDATCEKQRLAFGTLSSALYGLLKNVELKNARVYHEFCPMAFNDKGAYWLSDDAEIKNPYFGKKMLECGELTDSLK